ncbi:hypothetical protein [Actinacidiphila glaucinigra]|uniref:hypothetical protein n=1 Tax=Actinacidiphila glaucinigra TaxID=235986 RepID=UPI0038252CB5
MGRKHAFSISPIQPDPGIFSVRRSDTEADYGSGYLTGLLEASCHVHVTQKVKPEVMFDLVWDEEILLAGNPKEVFPDVTNSLGGVALLWHGLPE